MTWLTGDWSPIHRIMDRVRAPWFEACENRPGVYRLIAICEGTADDPATLDRICGRDETGTLYIGAAPRSLTGRIGQLVLQHDPNRKGGGHLPLPPPLARLYPAHQLGVRWSYVGDDADVFVIEHGLLDAYMATFGERPPLNSMG